MKDRGTPHEVIGTMGHSEHLAVSRPAGDGTNDPAYVDIPALIELCESHAGVLSMEPTPFQLEQAVNFLVATVPSCLRKLGAALASPEART